VTQGRAVTSQQTNRLLDGLRLGMTRRAACAHAGFSRTTLYTLLQRKDGLTLLAAIEKAEGEAEGLYTAKVAAAADDPKNWTAAAWWLERRHPDDFGRKDRVEVRVDLRTIAGKVAPDVDVDEVIAEAERIMAESR
jgi:hypothetical protein